MRFLLFLGSLLLASHATVSGLRAQQVHGIAMHGEPALKDGFRHLGYVRPDAPKGGRLVLGSLGAFDSLNPFIVKGVAAEGLREFLYESLMTRSLDEAFTLYGLLAERIEVPDDRSAITFHLNPKAAFSDGHSVDADDLLFSWKVLRDKGRPNHRTYYSKVTNAERLSDRTVRFDLGSGEDRELPLILGLMPILPAHIFSYETFESTTLEAPIGSGPYRISKIDAGRALTYERNKDWWGNDLPVARGRYNFDTIRFDYFRDSSVMFEAFKAGKIHIREEYSPANWAESYNIKAVKDGRLIKRSFDIALPDGMRAFVFNQRRQVFADQRVRRALIHLFDFQWVNKSLFHNLFQRTQSYFERSRLSSVGIPADPYENELLKRFPGSVNASVLAGTYRLPQGDGRGRNRQNLQAALKLLNEAGYELNNRRMMHKESGQPLAFEMLATSTSQERLFLAYTRELKRLGIDAKIRVVDSAQYQARRRTYDYDMIQFHWRSSLSPGNEQLFRWSSELADREGTFNYAGVKNPAVDAMIKAMLAARTSEDFVSSVHALDRVLLSGDYVIPLYHLPKQWVAYWNFLDHPTTTSLWGYQRDTWWRKPGTED